MALITSIVPDDILVANVPLIGQTLKPQFRGTAGNAAVMGELLDRPHSKALESVWNQPAVIIVSGTSTVDTLQTVAGSVGKRPIPTFQLSGRHLEVNPLTAGWAPGGKVTINFSHLGYANRVLTKVGNGLPLTAPGSAIIDFSGCESNSAPLYQSGEAIENIPAGAGVAYNGFGSTESVLGISKASPPSGVALYDAIAGDRFSFLANGWASIAVSHIAGTPANGAPLYLAGGNLTTVATGEVVGRIFTIGGGAAYIFFGH